MTNVLTFIMLELLEQKAIVLINSTERFNFQHDLKRAKPSQFLSLNGLEGLYKNI